MCTFDDFSSNKMPKLSFSLWNYPIHFKYCEGFYNSLKNYNLDFSNMTIPDCLFSFSEQNPIFTQTDIPQELHDMLIYISSVQVCYHQSFHEKSPISESISFTKYGTIFFGIKNFLRNCLYDLSYTENPICKMYPLKQYNIFYNPNAIFSAFEEGTSAKELPHAEQINTKRKLSTMLNYYHISFLEKELFIDDSDNNFAYSIPTASILSMTFLLCLHKQRTKLPLHVQYMVISDAVINISVAKKHSLKAIMQRLLKIREEFLKVVKNAMKSDKHLKSPKKSESPIELNPGKCPPASFQLKTDDFDFLCSISALDYYESQKVSFELDYNFFIDKQKLHIFRQIEQQILKQSNNPDPSLNHAFLDHFKYSEGNPQPLSPENIYYTPSDKIIYEIHLIDSFVKKYLAPDKNPFCPLYFINFFD